MAQFKIEFINLIPQLTDINRQEITTSIAYTSSIISDFKSQINDYNTYSEDLSKSYTSYCFAFDEKFSIHKNSQKELSFSMYKKVLLNQDWIDNPFVPNLHVGSQILLTDKYDHVHLFTITKINLEFNEINIKYNYNCQDTFNYQLIRQNEGYTIHNDPTSNDFIGAKTTDWWIVNKIVPECYIPYKYFSFKEKGNNLVTKPSYLEEIFQETIPFSCSGSNAAASLIDLASKIGCMIHVEEKKAKDQNKLYRYFWLEPEKQLKSSGLVYTPNTDLQSFNLSLTGDSLTTVLNVNSNTVDDQEISMFPSIPSFFNQLFSSTSWSINKKYYQGMFTDLIDGTKSTPRDLLDDNKVRITNNYGIELKITAIPQFTEAVSFSWDGNYTTVDNFSSLGNSFSLLLVKGNEIYELKEDISIPKYWLEQTNIKIYLKSKDISNDNTDHFVYPYIYWYRTSTEEERTFAEIADQCPWLENKLIDFNYFLNQKIISQEEYLTIMNYLKNDIRVINGKLMFYAAGYYEALHKKTKIISDLTNALDKTGAEMQADIIAPFSTFGKIKTIDNFKKDFDAIYQNYNSEKNLKILNYSELLGEYFTKGFNTDQRFLKNIKEFRDYFYAINSYSDHYLHFLKKTITNQLNPNSNWSTDGTYWITFDVKGVYTPYTNQNYDLIEDGYNKIVFYKHNEYNQYLPMSIVTKNNYDKYFVRKETNQQPQPVTEFGFNKYRDYYLKQQFYNKLFPDKPNTTDENVLLTQEEIKQIYLYKNFNKYYERVYNWYIPFDWLRFDTVDFNQIALKNINHEIIPMPTSQYEEWNKNSDEYVESYYKYNFPLSELYFYGDVYSVLNKPATAQEGTYLEHTIKNTHKKDFQLINFVTGLPNGPLEIQDLDLDAYLEYTDSKKNAFNYFSGVINPVAAKWGAGLRYAAIGSSLLTKLPIPGFQIFGALSVVLAATSFLPAAIAKLRQNIEWIQKYNPDFFFTTNSNGKHESVDHDKPFWDDKKAIFANKANSDELRIQYTEEAKAQNITTTEYFNYYSLLAATYSFEYQDPIKEDQLQAAYNNQLEPINYKLWIKNNKYYRFLCSNDYISRSDEYACNVLYIDPDYTKDTLTLQDIKNSIVNWQMFNTNNFFENNEGLASHWNTNFSSKISALQFYIIQRNLEKMTLDAVSEDFWKNNNYIQINDLMKNNDRIRSISNLVDSSWINRPDKSKYFFYSIVPNADSNKYILMIFNIMHIEDYEHANLNINNDNFYYNWDNFNKYIKNINFSRIYNKSTEQRLDILAQSDLFESFVIDGQKVSFLTKIQDDANWRHATKEDLDVLNQTFYKEKNITTLADGIIKQDTIEGKYKLETDQEEVFFLNESADIITILSTISDTDSLINEKKFQYDLYKNYYDQNYIKHKEFINSYETSNNTEIKFEDENGNTKDIFIFTIKKDNNKDPEKLGAITNGQLWYKYHNSDNSILYELSLDIETKLTESWMQAYSASLYSSYFLPSQWTFNDTKSINGFANQLIFSDGDNIRLNKEYIPEVNILNINGKTKWPHYNFKFKETDITIINSEDTENCSLLTEIKNTFNNYTPFLMDYLINLGYNSTDILNQIYVDKTFDDIYYYTEGNNNGTHWKDVIHKLSPDLNYERFRGRYVTMYNIFVTYYKNMEMPMYLQLLKSKQEKWKQLYNNFPSIFLEKTYSNSDAVTSQDLFKMAKLTFNDQIKPERQYNLSLIDMNALKGYTGQELYIGTPIQLAAKELYDSYDDIYDALNQYLFITDISYDLRKDSDINITVNSIKYQEKLLQQLVKLIR